MACSVVNTAPFLNSRHPPICGSVLVQQSREEGCDPWLRQ